MDLYNVEQNAFIKLAILGAGGTVKSRWGRLDSLAWIITAAYILQGAKRLGHCIFRLGSLDELKTLLCRRIEEVFYAIS